MTKLITLLEFLDIVGALLTSEQYDIAASLWDKYLETKEIPLNQEQDTPPNYRPVDSCCRTCINMILVPQGGRHYFICKRYSQPVNTAMICDAYSRRKGGNLFLDEIREWTIK